MFYSKYRKKHALRECPTDSIEVCRICEAKHSTDQCPSLPQIKSTYLADHGVINALYAMAPQRPWQPRATGMSQPHYQVPYTKNQIWNIPMPWQPWPPQQPCQGNISYATTQNFPSQNFYPRQPHNRKQFNFNSNDSSCLPHKSTFSYTTSCPTSV